MLSSLRLDHLRMGEPQPQASSPGRFIHEVDPPNVNLPFRESSEVVRYNARVRAERPTWTSAGNWPTGILSFGPDDVELVASKVPEPLKRILHKALRGSPDDRTRPEARCATSCRQGHYQGPHAEKRTALALRSSLNRRRRPSSRWAAVPFRMSDAPKGTPSP